MKKVFATLISFCFASVFISCNKVEEKPTVNASIEAKIKSSLNPSEKIITIDLIKTDTISSDELAGFISNYAFNKMKPLREKQFALQKKADSTGAADENLESITDSLKIYESIVTQSLKVKNTGKPEIIQEIYRVHIQKGPTEKTSTFIKSYFRKSDTLLSTSEMFKIEAEQLK